MTSRADYVKARDLAIEADAKGLPSEHLWARAQELRPAEGGCDCPHKPNGRLDTPRGAHIEGCPLKGARASGKGGLTSPAVREAYERKRLRVCVPPGAYASGKDRALAAAQKAGLASADELVTAAIEHVEAGGKFSSR